MFQNNLKTFALLLAVGTSGVYGQTQTQVDLRTQAKTIDFTQAPATRPVKTDVAANLPATCTVGDLFFMKDAAQGANLYGCVAMNTWSLQSGGGSSGSGSVTIYNDSGSTPVGSRSTLNFIAGNGLINLISDTGTEVNVQQAVDASYVETRGLEQSGVDLTLSCSSGNAAAYACSPNGNALTGYTDQQRFGWKPDVSCTAAPTINISSLGAKQMYRSDGTAIQAGDCAAGAQVSIWFDENANVGATTTGTASSGSTALTVASGTGIVAGQWVSGTGIAYGTQVASVTGTAVTLSQATTAALSAGGVTFSAGGFKLTAPYNPGFANPMTTEGDLLYEHSGAPSRLALGTQYQVLQAGATDPVYGALNLAQSAAVTGVLGSANGGTGVNNGSSTLTLGGNLATSGAFPSTFTMTGTTAVTFPTSGTLLSTGSIVGSANGGTGVNNGSSTLTLGGNLATSGAFASTFTMTGTTAVTFPTSGTLMTTGNSVALAQTPLAAVGDMLYANATPALARLAGNTSSTLNVLTQTGTGSASAAPVWQSASAAGIAPFTLRSVTFSATPTFTFGSGATTFEMTLTGNVTSVTVSGATAGQSATFILCQDSTGSRTFAWPAAFHGATTIGTTASKCSAQTFAYDGTTYYATAAAVTNQ